MEILRDRSPRPVRAVVFDFDGTLSLLRGGWATIMLRQMVREIGRHGDADEGRLRAGILGNNGRPTIWQMRFLAEQVRLIGAEPRTPEEYLADFLELLLDVVGRRRATLASGTASATDFTVPGALTMLAALKEKGIPLVLVSGTDFRHVESEAQLLGIAPFFDGRLHAPKDEDPNFTKRAVIERFLADSGLAGEHLAGFGDGAVETAEVKRVGGTAVAVACDEENVGQLDPHKRAVLVAAGADAVIPDYRDVDGVLRWLLPKNGSG